MGINLRRSAGKGVLMLALLPLVLGTYNIFGISQVNQAQDCWDSTLTDSVAQNSKVQEALEQCDLEMTIIGCGTGTSLTFQKSFKSFWIVGNGENTFKAYTYSEDGNPMIKVNSEREDRFYWLYSGSKRAAEE